jgi:hypothetical protein
VWRGALHDLVHEKFGYDLSLRLHKPLLCSALQFRVGVRFRDLGATLDFDLRNETDASSNKLEIQCLVAFLPRVNYPPIEALKCFEFRVDAELFMSREEWDLSIQALHVSLFTLLDVVPDLSLS